MSSMLFMYHMDLDMSPCLHIITHLDLDMSPCLHIISPLGYGYASHPHIISMSAYVCYLSHGYGYGSMLYCLFDSMSDFKFIMPY